MQSQEVTDVNSQFADLGKDHLWQVWLRPGVYHEKNEYISLFQLYIACVFPGANKVPLLRDEYTMLRGTYN